MSASLRYVLFLSPALLILVLDQVTKGLAHDRLLGGLVVDILPVFSLVLVFNKGAAFGFLNDAGGWQNHLFVGLALVFSLVLLVWIRREQERNRWLAIGLSLLLGGAIGNLFDRIMNGYVVDFLLFHYGDWMFPAFNVADVAITMGAVMMIMDSLLFRHK